MASTPRTILFHGLALATLAATATGCRFGNYVEYPEEPFSGYYEMEPAELVLYAQTDVEQTVPALPEAVPSDLSSILTNPIKFQVSMAANSKYAGTAYFESIQDGQTPKAMEVLYDTTGLLYREEAQLYDFTSYPGCQLKLSLAEQGKLQPENKTFKTGSTLPLKGRVELVVTVFNELVNCDAHLRSMWACYQDLQQCGQGSTEADLALQMDLQWLFDRYIKAGLLNATNFTLLKAVAYQVSYH